METPSLLDELREHLAAIEVLASDMRDQPGAYLGPAAIQEAAAEINAELDAIWDVLGAGLPGTLKPSDPLSDAVPLEAPTDAEGG